MKYADKIKDYINNNGNIGERHEELEDEHPRDPLTGAQLRDIDPEFEEPQEAPKKKRGRPVGSKNKPGKTSEKTTKQPEKRRTRSPHISETSLCIGMSQQLFGDIEKAATHNFRTLAGEVCWVLTQYYNGKL